MKNEPEGNIDNRRDIKANTHHLRREIYRENRKAEESGILTKTMKK